MKRTYEFGINSVDVDAVKIEELISFVHMNVSPMFLIYSNTDDLATGTILSCEDFAERQRVFEKDPDIAVYLCTGMEVVKVKSRSGYEKSQAYFTNLMSYDFVNSLAEEYGKVHLRVTWNDGEKAWDEEESPKVYHSVDEYRSDQH